MTSIAEVENQIKQIEAKRAALLGDVAALDAREKALRAARSEQLAAELFDNRKGGKRLGEIDADLGKVVAHAAELRDLLGAADSRLADLREGKARVQFDEDRAAWPGLCEAQRRELAEFERRRAELLACAIRLNERDLPLGRMWQRIQKNARALGLGPEAWEDLPGSPGVRWGEEKMQVTPAMLSGARQTKAARFGVTRAQLGELVTK